MNVGAVSIKYRFRAYAAVQRILRPVVIDCMHDRSLFALAVDDDKRRLVDAQRQAAQNERERDTSYS